MDPKEGIQMKRTVVCAFIVVVCAASPLFAQRNEQDQIRLTRAVIQTERHAIVAEGMDLTKEEADAFWPLFRRYHQEIDVVGDREVQLILDYAEHHQAMTDDRASALLDEYLSIQKAILKIQTRYVKQFRKIMSSKKVTRYFQLENKLDAMIDAEMAAQIPLVE
jgi:hypothetical protein